MHTRSSRLRNATLVLAGLVAAWLLFAWLGLPVLLQSAARDFVAEKSAHRLTLDRPEFNPFALRLRLANLSLAEPDGAPLLGFRELSVDVSVASLWRRALVVEAIRLDGATATVVQRADGRLNWSALVAALRGPEDAPDTPPPRFDIEHFVLVDGRVDFRDEAAGFATRIEPLALELANITTLPDGAGRYQVAARTTLGASLRWQGQATLAPLAATGSLAIEDLDLSRLAGYLDDRLRLGPPAGTLAASTDYRFELAGGRPGLVLEHMQARIADLRLSAAGSAGPSLAIGAIEAQDGRYDLAAKHLSLGAVHLAEARGSLPQAGGKPVAAQLAELAVEAVQLDLAARQLALGRVALRGGRLDATRDAKGRIDVAEALATLASSAPSGGANADTGAPPAPWRFRIDRVELADFAASLRDETVSPAAELAISDLAVGVEGISDDLATPLAVHASFRARGGGRFEAEGRVVPGTPTADLRLRLTDLALKPAQPYLGALARLTLARGRLSADGRATYGPRGPEFRGGFALRDLYLTETGTDELFLAWKSLASRDLRASDRRLQAGTLTLGGLDTKILIAKDKTVNLARVLRRQAPGPAPAAGKPAGPAYEVAVDRLRVEDGALDFADESLALPFGTRIHHLRGTVVGLSTRPDGPGLLELEGQVDDYGEARAGGGIDLFDPARHTDLKVLFRNVEMTRLTPYSATFAGRRIASGKLTLNLEYKVKDRQLAGDNQILMDRLTLGERVESPEAKDLPLDLAVAILQDADGRIDLGLPVSGSLDDPEFSYAGIIWKAFLNVIGKIVTAPFRALAALFGSAEPVENLVFEAGRGDLSPPEREKLARLAGALAKRPTLMLTIQGLHADSDRLALQDRQLRRILAERQGLRLEPGADPGPMATSSPQVRTALEDLYAERLGGAELAALKEGFRVANPGQLEEGTAGRIASRLAGLFRESRTLGDQEVARLKGADFPAVLYERLRNGEAVTDGQLTALAAGRGELVAAGLRQSGIAAERLASAPPAKAAGDVREIPVLLSLGALPAAR